MTMTIIVLVDMCKHETKGTFDHINEQDKATSPKRHDGPKNNTQ